MAKASIVTIPNKILTQKTTPVEKLDGEIIVLAQNLVDTLDSASEPEGAGIAANQIGSDKRVCVVRQFFEDPHRPDRYTYEDLILINPKIVSFSKDTDTDWEGCLSIPNVYGKVERYLKIKVKSTTLSGNEISFSAHDFFARVIQHEIDHLDGILFTSRVKGKTINEEGLDRILRKEAGH
ncbi:peptide deformylase [candidate division WWE3 bacterium RIFOXYC1_FULL_39_7]|uniref:Peptide deformylase n=2 Tax=Katanobacteria TaxID=422282 RepID=A0A1F4X7C1_UNCKA|nr:MAG: peptide deformylase [candidate division WWE3 bacterium RIFOXYC1_FULL_39_7]OGC77610.1 MAG: peptide deformylase [candidate division WWE3 bacterium RIFOXYD1_FULL_39_9]